MLYIPRGGKQSIDERILLVFPIEDKDVLWIDRTKGRKRWGEEQRTRKEVSDLLQQIKASISYFYHKFVYLHVCVTLMKLYNGLCV